MSCDICDDVGWICEMTGKPFGDDTGAGVPCVCNPSADVDFEYVMADASGSHPRMIN